MIETPTTVSCEQTERCCRRRGRQAFFSLFLARARPTSPQRKPAGMVEAPQRGRKGCHATAASSLASLVRRSVVGVERSGWQKERRCRRVGGFDGRDQGHEGKKKTERFVVEIKSSLSRALSTPTVLLLLLLLGDERSHIGGSKDPKPPNTTFPKTATTEGRRKNSICSYERPA